jgi:hypothetical protein
VADAELGAPPVHITVVGPKADPRSRALHAAALRYPTAYKRVEWWDRKEGPLPASDVAYPELDVPAAFACGKGACSRPVFEPQKLGEAVDRLAREP